MIKCEVIEQFTLKDFDKLSNIKRKSIDVKGLLFVGDTFECDEEMVKYLTGNNEDGDVVVKVIEVEPKKTIEETEEYKKELMKVLLETEIGNDINEYKKATNKIVKNNLKKKKTSKK